MLQMMSQMILFMQSITILSETILVLYKTAGQSDQKEKLDECVIRIK